MANQQTTFRIEILTNVTRQEIWNVADSLDQVEGVTSELQEPGDFITPTLLLIHFGAPHL